MISLDLDLCRILASRHCSRYYLQLLFFCHLHFFFPPVMLDLAFNLSHNHTLGIDAYAYGGVFSSLFYFLLLHQHSQESVFTECCCLLLISIKVVHSFGIFTSFHCIEYLLLHQHCLPPAAQPHHQTTKILDYINQHAHRKSYTLAQDAVPVCLLCTVAKRDIAKV